MVWWVGGGVWVGVRVGGCECGAHERVVSKWAMGINEAASAEGMRPPFTPPPYTHPSRSSSAVVNADISLWTAGFVLLTLVVNAPTVR